MLAEYASALTGLASSHVHHKMQHDPNPVLYAMIGAGRHCTAHSNTTLFVCCSPGCGAHLQCGTWPPRGADCATNLVTRTRLSQAFRQPPLQRYVSNLSTTFEQSFFVLDRDLLVVPS